jgi:putative hemolysin
VGFTKLIEQISTPSLLAEKDQFLIKFADSEEEIEQALRLRYRIFNLEQGKGLDSANDDGIDRDEYDEFCLHLIVVDKRSENIVGTYRIHVGSVAMLARGLYSSREYNISGLDKIIVDTIEVGRSCVAPEHRSGVVVALLWAGISELLSRSKLKYLLGCVSLETVEPVVGWGLYHHFRASGKDCKILSADATEEFKLSKPTDEEIASFLEDKRRVMRSIPPLFKGYLRLGAKICGEPALDEEFGSIDFLILLDTRTLPERYNRHFCVEQESN